MALTKKERKYLEGVLYDLRRAIRFVKSQEIVIAQVDKRANTTNHYIRPSDGFILQPLTKECGSNLVGLFHAADDLDFFLHPPSQEEL